VPDSPTVPDTTVLPQCQIAATVPDSTHLECQIAKPTVPDTEPTVPDSASTVPDRATSADTVLPSIQPSIQPACTGKIREGWLDLFQNQNLETFGVPPKATRADLDALAAKHGEEIVLAALRAFENRPNGFGGLTKITPWGLWEREKAQWLAKPISAANEKKQRRENNVAGGRRLLAEELKKVAALNPTPEEQAYIDAEIAKANAILTSGKKYEDGPELEFWIRCLVLTQPDTSLSNHIRTERWRQDEARQVEVEHGAVITQAQPGKCAPGCTGGPEDYVGAENVQLCKGKQVIGTLAEVRAESK
jgi:hypothetical protein